MVSNNKDNKIVGYEQINDKILIKYKNVDDESQCIGNLVRFASYITASARTNLAIVMREIGHEHIYYCDTDSIFTDKDPPKEYIDQKMLGKWKQEKVKGKLADIEEAYFLAPKSYMFKVDSELCMKAKGQKSSTLKPEYFKKVNEGGEQQIENDAMFFRKLDSIHIRPQTRTLKAVYNKRIWDGNNSRPFKNMKEWHMAKYGK